MTSLNKTFVSAAFAAVASAAAEKYRVTSMPDMADFDRYGFYSGYVGVSTTSAMHYLFVEA